MSHVMLNVPTWNWRPVLYSAFAGVLAVVLSLVGVLFALTYTVDSRKH